MMATATPSLSPFEQFKRALANLFQAGHGTTHFTVGADGELVPGETVITVKQQPGESLEAFHQRFRRDYGLRPGDQVEILNSNGRTDTVRLHLQPR